jgi:PAS domain S-box-containing protein
VTAPHRLVSRAVPFAVVLIGYVVFGLTGLSVASLHPSATPVWPPTGWALAALLIGGLRLWPAVFLGAFIVNVTVAGALATSLGIAAGNTAEAVVGAVLVRRFARGRDAFTEPHSIFVFCLLAGLVATSISATVGVASLGLGAESLPNWRSIWLTWWLGDAAGALVVAPFILVWATKPDPTRRRHHPLEVLALGLAIVSVSAVVFAGVIRVGTRDAPLTFACLAPLVWAAYRFGPRGATTALVLVGAIAAAGTLAGSGPLAVGGQNESLLLLQVFLVATAGTVLPLAALAEELARRARHSATTTELYRDSERRRRTTEAFLDTSRALAASLDVADVANRIVVAVREILGGTIAVVYRVDPETGVYDALAVAGDAGPDFRLPFSIPAGAGTIGLALREQRAVVTPDLLSDPRVVVPAELRHRVETAPHRAVLAVPLVADGAPVGAFLVGDRSGRVFTADETVLAEAFAQHAALAIANARRFEESREKEEELAEFFENAAVGLHWMGPDGTILRANRAELEMLGHAREEYVGRNVAEFHADPDAIEDIQQRLRRGETLRGYPARLRARDGTIRHVMIDANVHWVRGQFAHTRCFTRDVTSLRQAEQEMTRLLEAERAAREDAEAARARAEAAERQMTTLGEITRSITASLDLDTVLQRIAQGSQELCRSDTAAIFLRDGDSDAVVPRYRVGPALRIYEGLRIATGEGVGGHVLATGRPIRIREYVVDNRVLTFHAIARETWTVALMVVPIVIGDRVEGLLYISNTTPREFTPEDEAVSMRLAEQAAAAIRNARLFAETAQARTQAEAASRAKDEFVAMLSHELRTPLNAIVGWTRMLRMGTLAPEVASNALDVIARNADAQVQLIEDLLDMSRVVAGTLHVEVRPIKLAPVLAAALDAVRPAAERKGVRLSAHIAPTIDAVVGDPGRLQQVFWNLLVNAVKFTPRAGLVEVTAVADDDSVRIAVRDTGGGIDAAVLPHIFERFRQGDSSTTREHGGLGLGLALVKHLVDRHGGTVTAESDGPGKGATFVVTLRHTRADALQRRPALPPAPPRRDDLLGVSVVVVDDHDDARELCARLLSEHGASVIVAASTVEAMVHVEAVKPDVIIADIAMPGEDGFELLRRVRAAESRRARRTIVAAVTAYVSVEDRARIIGAGFDAHIPKPLEVDRLVATVRTLLDSR